MGARENRLPGIFSAFFLSNSTAKHIMTRINQLTQAKKRCKHAKNFARIFFY